MENRVQDWEHVIEGLDPLLDRRADASDIRVCYASGSRCSGIRYLVKKDELFPVTSPVPGGSTLDLPTV